MKVNIDLIEKTGIRVPHFSSDKNVLISFTLLGSLSKGIAKVKGDCPIVIKKEQMLDFIDTILLPLNERTPNISLLHSESNDDVIQEFCYFVDAAVDFSEYWESNESSKYIKKSIVSEIKITYSRNVGVLKIVVYGDLELADK